MFSVLKPTSAKLTRYVPVGSNVKRYLPVSSVTAVRAPPIMEGLETVTSTPGISALLLSCALPAMFPVVWLCGNAVETQMPNNRQRKKKQRTDLIFNFLQVLPVTIKGAGVESCNQDHRIHVVTSGVKALQKEPAGAQNLTVGGPCGMVEDC
jgi:hypothetical protein